MSRHPYPHSLAQALQRQQVRVRAWVLSCLLACAIAFASSAAHAQIFGDVQSSISCVVGAASGGMLSVGGCPNSIEDGKVFSYFVCRMEQDIGNVAGQFYCQLNNDFKAPMAAVITLAIITFGVAFMIGIIQATAKEAIMFLLKVAAVWGFATEADLLIGVAYKFFMGGLKEGIAIVIGGIFEPPSGFTMTSSGGQQVYEYMDQVLKKFVNFTTEASGTEATDQNYCKNALFAGLVLLAIAFPPLFAIGVFLLIKFILFFLRAVFGYIYAILGISFLIVLAPIFLAFAFWKQTREYFDKWVGHLAAFALQMVIIFAFIAFVLSLDVSRVAKELMDLVVPYNKSTESTGIKWPWQVCTICEFTVTDSSTGGGGGGKDAPVSSVKCKDNPGKPIDPAALMGPAHSGTRDTLMKLASKVLLTLLVLAYVVNALLDTIPGLAQQLANGGKVWSPNLTSRAENPLPGEEALETFQKQFGQRLGQGGNPITAYSEAFSEASKSLLVGSRDGGKGLQQTLTDWMISPVQ